MTSYLAVWYVPCKVELQQQLIAGEDRGQTGGRWCGLYEQPLFQWPIVQRNKRQHSLIIEGQWLEKVTKGSRESNLLWQAPCHSQHVFTQALISFLARALILKSARTAKIIPMPQCFEFLNAARYMFNLCFCFLTDAQNLNCEIFSIVKFKGLSD